MSTFERYLTVWVALCIVLGIALGHFIPGVFTTIGALEVAQVNLPVAVLIWLMIIPMLMKIDFAALRRVTEHWRGIGVTLFINWAVKPFSMAALGWFFIAYLFRPYLPADQIESYIAGLILLAAAPYTAMVFVWSNLSDGEPHFTLSQVALNDVIMVFAFAPIVGLLLGLSAITVPWQTLLLSVLLYIVVPVIIAQIARRSLLIGGPAKLQAALAATGPVSLLALLAGDDREGEDRPARGIEGSLLLTLLLSFLALLLLSRLFAMRFREDLRGAGLSDHYMLFGFLAGAVLPALLVSCARRSTAVLARLCLTGFAALALPGALLALWGVKIAPAFFAGMGMAVAGLYASLSARIQQLAGALLAAAVGVALTQWSGRLAPLAEASRAARLQVLFWALGALVLVVLVVDYGSRLARRGAAAGDAAGDSTASKGAAS